MSRGFYMAVTGVLFVGGLAVMASVAEPSDAAALAMWCLVAASGAALAGFLLPMMTDSDAVLAQRLWLFPAERERIAQLYEYLARSARLGLPAAEALSSRAADTAPRWIRERMRGLARALENGVQLSRAAAAYPAAFPEADCAVIEAGERTNRLAESFEYLAATARAQRGGNFPRFLVLAECLYLPAIVGFVLVFIIPKFKDLFDQLGGELPWTTLWLIDISIMVSHFFPQAVLAWIFLAVVWRALKRNAGVVARLLRAFPFAASFYWALPLSRFCYAMGTLVAAAVPVCEAFSLAVKASRSRILASSTDRVSERLASGARLDEALSDVATLPKPLLWFLGHGLEKERPEEALLMLADRYRDQHEVLALRLGSILFPIVTILLGLAALFVLCGLYMPLFGIPGILMGRE